jgi:hypothetical protein
MQAKSVQKLTLCSVVTHYVGARAKEAHEEA